MAGAGRTPLPIPEKVKVSTSENKVVVQGPKGSLDFTLHPKVHVQVQDGSVVIACLDESRESKALQGLTRKMIANMCEGVSRGFSRTLEINGVGYRAEPKGNSAIQFTLGYSHPIFFQLPPGIQAKVERQTVVTVEGIDKQLIGEVAAAIRRLRPPEPYKGKGVKYAEEKIRRKAGKTAGAR
ncbi:MAG TPA: 50S ribosomal protein L6 [Methylomirabilota bacterium]|jgi:large subunit ribosomal protein L6|nr:50S ribosomal protein L6 [Methylomirabilota bacterium]